jgi:hypothetical protein
MLRKSIPDRKELLNCFAIMASAMHMNAMNHALGVEVVNHVLYNSKLSGLDGKNAWESYLKGIITERELRNLVMAHAAAKISNYNCIEQPDFEIFNSKSLCNAFEISLFGRLANLQEIDILDPWEKNL